MTPEEAELEHAGRLLDREGVAMVLALVDETGAAPPVTDERMLADGAGQAALLESYRAALRRDAAADDAAAVRTSSPCSATPTGRGRSTARPGERRPGPPDRPGRPIHQDRPAIPDRPATPSRPDALGQPAS